MSWTKRQLIEAALGEIGISSDNFDIPPEDYQRALARLDSMIAMWNAKGLVVGYPIASNPTTADLDEDSNIPDLANEAVFLNLAIRLAPSYGKVIPQDTKTNALYAYNALLQKNSIIPEVQPNGSVPSGAVYNQQGIYLNTPTTSINGMGNINTF